MILDAKEATKIANEYNHNARLKKRQESIDLIEINDQIKNVVNEIVDIIKREANRGKSQVEITTNQLEKNNLSSFKQKMEFWHEIENILENFDYNVSFYKGLARPYRSIVIFWNNVG